LPLTSPVDYPSAARPLLGIALKLSGTVLLAGMAALVKVLSTKYPIMEIAFFRSVFGLLTVVVLILASRERLGWLRSKHPWAHVRRGMVGVGGLATTFLTLSLLPLADATALSFSAPLFLVMFAIPLLGERVGIYRLSAVAIGFVGVVMIAQPHVTGGEGVTPQPLGVAVGVLAAVLIALAQIALRFAGRTERTYTTVFYFSLSCALISALALPFGWTNPDWGGFTLLALTGLLGGVSQLCFTQSYRYADATALASFDYATLVWALFIGLIFFDEFPTAMVIGGALIVIASGLFIVFRERYLARLRRTALAETINT